MDALLGRFLARVRPRARSANRAVFEDVVVALDDYLSGRRRRANALRPRDLERFLAFWVLRHQRLASVGSRRFCAALRVVVRDLTAHLRDAPAKRLRGAASRVGRETMRVARASELFEGTSAGARETDARPLDGYWVVVLRSDGHAVVRALGARNLVGPVVLPASVLALLEPGDVINMSITPVGPHWCVLEHGPCYPSSALPALRDALQPATA